MSVDGNRSNHTKQLNGSLWSTGIRSRGVLVCGNRNEHSGPGSSSFDARWFVRLVGGWESIEPYGSVEGKPSVDGNWFARRVVIITVAVDQSSSSSSSQSRRVDHHRHHHHHGINKTIGIAAESIVMIIILIPVDFEMHFTYLNRC